MTFAYSVTPNEDIARYSVYSCCEHRAPSSRDRLWNHPVSVGYVARMGHRRSRHVRILRRYAPFGIMAGSRPLKPNSVPRSCSSNKFCHQQALASKLFASDAGLVRVLSRLSFLAVSGY
jgi:hypothetical protein